MTKLFRFLLMGLGVPFVAQQINHHGQNVSKKLMLVTFLTNHKKNIYMIGALGLFGSIFVVCGLSLIAFTFAVNSNLQINESISAAMIVSLSVTVIGLILTGCAWKQIVKMEKSFELEERHQQETSPSLTRTIFESILHAAVGSSVDFSSHKKTLN